MRSFLERRDGIIQMYSRIIRFILMTIMMMTFGIGVALAENPTVRVYLRRLVSDYPLEISMSGDYVNADHTMWFKDGTELTAAIVGEDIYLYGDSFSLNAGKKVSFVRTTIEEDAYLLLAGGKNAYAGDLTLTIQNGQIRPILTMEIEEYVRGVVPYELGDSFPLEALKAQAVAARSYALAKIGAHEDYDVDDTTNDQVFRGREANSPLSEQAVRETSGEIETRNGKPAVCYYTASNGGQTEDGQHVWPVEDKNAYTYMDVKDDPYDFQNEKSPVRRFVLPTSLNGKELNPDLSLILRKGVCAKLGQNLIPEQIRIDRFTDVQMADPRYSSKNRIMNSVVFTANYSVREIISSRTVQKEAEEGETPETETVYEFSDYEPAEAAVSFSLSFYGELERAMGLSINSTDNELLTIYYTEAEFIFETRRYGHGVGMSQRGAELMARSYGKTYREILEFYYPGLTLVKTEYESQTRPTDGLEVFVKPTPRPGPTPRPTLIPLTETELKTGEFLAEVANIDEDSSLNLRSSPSYGAEILTRLYFGQRLIVESETADGWSKVKTDVLSGYVRTEFLQAVQ